MKGLRGRGKSHITTNRIEGSFAHFKRTIKGIYHWVSKKHIQKYVDEFVCRFNTKDIPMLDRIAITINGGVGVRLTYEDLIHG